MIVFGRTSVLLWFFFLFFRRVISELRRPINLGDLDVSLYPPKAHFSEEHISAPKGCCAPKFLHALENHQVLLAHPHRGGGPPYNFFQR